MKIGKNSVVTFDYKLYEEEQLLESSHESGSSPYLHGHGGMLDALQEELEGKVAGEQVTKTLTPEQAYGYRREGAVERVPIKHIQGGKPFKPGRIVVIPTNHGPLQAVVIKAGRFNVDVDVNHPLAGKTLTFEIDIREVREATAQELTHGHAHGRGGHEH